jgi:hypothetical protein
MLIRKVLFLALVLFVSSLANAQSVKLTSVQISEILNGNTASGIWGGEVYHQYFGVDGTTTIIKAGNLKKIGKWKINDDTEEFLSRFPGDIDWQGWYIMEYSGDYYWVSKTTPPTKFKLEIGNKLK